MGGGRGWGERQSCLAGLQVYLHPASRRSGRGEAALRAGSQAFTWLSVGLRFWFFSSKLHVCETEEKPQLTPQRQHTSGSHSNCTPRLAVWLPSVLTICEGSSGHLETFTVSQVYQTMPKWLGTRERQSTMVLAMENKQVSLQPKSQSHYPR